MSPQKSKNILERLDAGEVIIGDGSYCNTLEKRGYVKVQSKAVGVGSHTTSTAPGRLLHARELSGAPGGCGDPGRGVLQGRGGHHAGDGAGDCASITSLRVTSVQGL